MPESDRLYFRQLLSGRDFASGDMMATQMRNFAYLIGDRQTGECLVVDPAYAAGDLVDAAEADGMRLSGVLVTHHHPDHVGGSMMGFELKGLAELLERVSVPVHVNTHEALWVSRITGIAPGDLTAHEHGDKVSVGAIDIELLHTPGHTHDHLCLFSPADGVLLAGDHVLPSITPHISGLLEGDPLASYLESLDKVCALDDVEIALPAHGHPFRDLPGRVASIKEHHAGRLDELRAASDGLGWASVEALSHELFSERSWGPMAESETYAHVEHLRIVGEAEVREEAGRLLFLVR